MSRSKLASEKYDISEIIEVARSLLEPSDNVKSEYARGVCELIGRLRLDFGSRGEGTGENAREIATTIGVRI